MGLESPNRRWFEQTVILVLVVVVGFLVASNIYYQNKAGKQKMLFYQLQILRNSINLYKFINNKNPENLEILAAEYYKWPGEDITRKFIENAPIDKNGIVIDPFGKQYYYDGKTGWLRSASEGYEFW